MNDKIDDLLSGWLDDAEQNPTSENDNSANDASQVIAESLLIHGLLTDIGSRDDEQDADRVSAVMRRIDSGSNSEPVSIAQPNERHGRRRFAILTSALTMAAALMVMFVVFGPHQSVSAAMASLEQVVEAAAKPIRSQLHRSRR